MHDRSTAGGDARLWVNNQSAACPDLGLVRASKREVACVPHPHPTTTLNAGENRLPRCGEGGYPNGMVYCRIDLKTCETEDLPTANTSSIDRVAVLHVIQCNPLTPNLVVYLVVV